MLVVIRVCVCACVCVCLQYFTLLVARYRTVHAPFMPFS